MEKKYPLLNDREVYPDDAVIAAAMAGGYAAFCGLCEALPERGITIEWRYYNDGKAWLCKGTAKRKTVFWLAAWSGYFKITCYFNAPASEGVYGLQISDEIKETFRTTKPVGKSMPLTIEVSDTAQLADVLTILDYKKSLK